MERTLESKSIEINHKNENINSCVYALIQIILSVYEKWLFEGNLRFDCI